MKTTMTHQLGPLWANPLGLGVYEWQDLTIPNLKLTVPNIKTSKKDDGDTKAETDFHGTDAADTVTFYESGGTKNIFTYDGDDKVTLNGFADYSVHLGDGRDHATINSVSAAVVDGGEGHDKFFVQTMANHSLFGGAGVDAVYFHQIGEGMIIDLLEGTARLIAGGAHEISFSGIEHIYGTNSDDVMRTGDTGDDLWGGDGNDQLYGGDGLDYLSGGDGDDIIFGGSYMDLIYGGDDTDLLYGEEGDDYLYGDAGDDEIWAGAGSDSVYGGEGSDWVYASDEGAHGSDRFYGNNLFNHHDDGIDTLDYYSAVGGIALDVDAGQVCGSGAGATLSTGTGWGDTITFSVDYFSEFERFHGTQEDDYFSGGNDRDQSEWFFGGRGDDQFEGSKGADHFHGGSDYTKYQNDIGFDGFDVVSYKTFYTGFHADLQTGIGWVKTASGIVPVSETYQHKYQMIDGVVGSNHKDHLIGNDYDNMFEGGGGSDTMTGNGGADTFVFKQSSGWAIDKITDFTSGEDILELHSMAMIPGAGGGVVENFADLDSNSDGVLNGADAAMISSVGANFLMFANNFIELQGVMELQASDFVFA